MIARYLLIDWLPFAGALALLLTPIGWFHGRKIHFRPISRDWDRHWAQTLSLGLHAIDLGRAALGTWWLAEAVHGVTGARGLASYAVLLTLGSIRVLAVFLQTVVCKEPDSANAPFAFVAGLMLGGTSPLIGVLALVLAITVAMGARAPAAFFPVVGLARLGLGFWFGGKGLLVTLVFGACAAMLPWLWSLLFSRELVVAYRARPREEDGPVEPHELR
jgi:hypothetical protein